MVSFSSRSVNSLDIRMPWISGQEIRHRSTCKMNSNNKIKQQQQQQQQHHEHEHQEHNKHQKQNKIETRLEKSAKYPQQFF